MARSVSLDILRARVTSEMHVDPSGVVSGTRAISTHLDRTQAKVKQTVDQFGYLALSLKRIATYSAIFTFFGGMARVLGQVTELQLRQAEVSTLVDTRNKQMARSFELVKNAILEIDPHLGNAIELTKGLYEIMSAGVNDPVEALQLLKVSAKYAKAGLTDLATAASTATSIMKAYGLTANDMREKLDMLFGAVQEGKFHTADLNAALGKILPTAAAMGVSIEEVGMALAMLSQRGLDANQAATGLNRMFLAFLKPLDKTKAAFTKLGLEWGRNAFAARSFGDVMAVIRDGMNRYGDLLPLIFTRQRGLRAGFLFTGQGLEDYNRMLAKATELTEGMGVVERGVIKIKKTLSSELKAMQAEILQTAAAWMQYSGVASVAVRMTKDMITGLMRAPQFLAALAVILTRTNVLMKAQAMELANVVVLQRMIVRERIANTVLTAEQGAMYGQLEVTRQAGMKYVKHLRMMRIGMLGVVGAFFVLNEAIRRWGERIKQGREELMQYTDVLVGVARDAGILGEILFELGVGSTVTLRKRAREIGYEMMLEMFEGMKGKAHKIDILGFTMRSAIKRADWWEMTQEMARAMKKADMPKSLIGSMIAPMNKMFRAFLAGDDITKKYAVTLNTLLNALNLTAVAQARANDEFAKDVDVKPLLEKYNRQYLLIMRDLPDALKEMHPEELAGTFDLEKLQGMRDALAQAFGEGLNKGVRERLDEAGYTFEKYGDKIEIFGGRIDKAIGLRKDMEWSRGITEFTRQFTQHLDELAPGAKKVEQAAEGMTNAWQEYKDRGIASVKAFVKHNKEWLEILKLNWDMVPEDLRDGLGKFMEILDASGKAVAKAREKAVKGLSDWGTDMKAVLSDIAQYENKLNDKKYANESVKIREKNRLYKESLDEQLANFNKFYSVSIYLRAAYLAQLAALDARQRVADKVAEADRILAIRKNNMDLLGSNYEYNFEKLRAAKRAYAEEMDLIKMSVVFDEQAKAKRLALADTFWGNVISSIMLAMTVTERYIAVLRVFGGFFNRMSDSFRDMFAALRIETEFTSDFVDIVGALGKGFLDVSNAIRDAERAMKSWGDAGGDFLEKLTKVATVADAVVTIVTTLITVFAKLFGGKSATEKAADEAERLAYELGEMARGMQKAFSLLTATGFVTISESLAKTLAEMQQKGMPGWLAQLKLFDKIIADLGINTDNFRYLALSLAKVLHATADGFLASYEGAEVFGKAFKQLIDFAKANGIEGHKSLLELIRLTKELGIEVAEVTAYIREQLIRAAGGLAKAIMWIAQDAVDAHSEIKNLTKEKRKLLREIGRIQEQMKKYGMGSEEYIEAQEEIDDLIKQIRKLDNQMANHQSVLDNVSNATRKHIKDLGIIAATVFNAMVAEGVPLFDIMDEMSEAIFALIDRYKALGMVVPVYLKDILKVFKAFRDNPEFFEGLRGLADVYAGLGNSFTLTAEAFRALNREARRYYKLLTMSKEEGGMGFGDEQAIRLMYPVLQKMWWYAEQYGMKLPKWAQEAIQKAKDYGLTFEAPIANQQLDAMLGVSVGIGESNDYLKPMARNIWLMKNYMLGEGYAMGSPNIGRTQFARIHSGEAVVPENLADAMREFFTGRVSGGFGGGGGATTLIVNLDGRQVYKGLVPHLREGGAYGDFELAGESVS